MDKVTPAIEPWHMVHLAANTGPTNPFHVMGAAVAVGGSEVAVSVGVGGNGVSVIVGGAEVGLAVAVGGTDVWVAVAGRGVSVIVGGAEVALAVSVGGSDVASVVAVGVFVPLEVEFEWSTILRTVHSALAALRKALIVTRAPTPSWRTRREVMIFVLGVMTKV